MSQITVNRLPSHIKQLFNVYKRCHDYMESINSFRIKHHLLKLSSHHSSFTNSNIIHNTLDLNTSDYPPLKKSLIQPMFLQPLDPIESLSVDEILRPKYKQMCLPRRIPSSRTTAVARYTPYHANLLKSFAAYYSPNLSVPATASHKNIFTWFRRLLDNTPIIVFLRQENRLFSDSCMNQLNLPLNQLHDKIKVLDQQYNTTRSYHLTSLVDFDLLELAIKSDADFTSSQSQGQDPFTSVPWALYIDHSNVLCDELKLAKGIQVLENEQLVNEFQHLENYDLHQVYKDMEVNPVRDVFPYDVSFHDLFILTVEKPVLELDHRQLMNILDGAEGFEIFAVLFNTKDPVITESFESHIGNLVKKDSNYNYEDLLKIAKSTHRHEYLDQLIKYFAEHGLSNVQRDGNIYLTRDNDFKEQQASSNIQKEH